MSLSSPFPCNDPPYLPFSSPLPPALQAAMAAMAAEEDRRSRMLQAIRQAEERRAVSVRRPNFNPGTGSPVIVSRYPGFSLT